MYVSILSTSLPPKVVMVEACHSMTVKIDIIYIINLILNTHYFNDSSFAKPSSHLPALGLFGSMEWMPEDGLTLFEI